MTCEDLIKHLSRFPPNHEVQIRISSLHLLEYPHTTYFSVEAAGQPGDITPCVRLGLRNPWLMEGSLDADS